MPEGDGSTGSQPGGSTHLPWHLIPAFKPGETEVNDYTRRLEFLASIWPKEHLAQLAPRACLLCEGTAFSKVVRIDPEKLKTPTVDGIKLVVKTLGGVWGQSKLERKYERFEKAIFGTVQKSDETNASYLARHEVQYEELINMGASLEEMRAYILIRNSGLPAEDKKRIIVDSQGNLDYNKVTESLQLLRSRFFGEVQTGIGSKSGGRTKTYDVNYVDDGEHETEDHDETAFFSSEISEETGLEHLLQEGDEDALLIQQFEDSLIESLQADSEIATCLNTYVEARKRVLEKVKSRGFWNPKGSKGKSKGKFKGGFKNKFRKPLAQRILESTCRLCNQPGHWKAECPLRQKGVNSSQPSSASAFAGVAVALEALTSSAQTCDLADDEPPDHAQPFAMEETCLMIHGHDIGSNGNNWGYNDNNKGSWKSMLTHRLQAVLRKMNEGPKPEKHRKPDVRNPLSHKTVVVACKPEPTLSEETVHFASHGTHGIVDLGASMSVIGERQFQELCQVLPLSIKKTTQEASCSVSFRFGNDSTVVGRRAVYFPVGSKWIKVVIVPTNTPFLIANSVFRSLGAIIDVAKQQIRFEELGKTVPIRLTDRKLFRLDLMDLLQKEQPAVAEDIMHTYHATPKHEAICEVYTPGHNPVTGDKGKTVIHADTQPASSEKTISDGKLIRFQSALTEQSSHPPCRKPHVVQHFGPPVRRSGRSLTPTQREREVHRRRDCHHHGHDTGGPSFREGDIWKGPCGQNVPRDGHRDKISDMVHGNIPSQPQARACQAATICAAPPGAAREESCESQQECDHAQGQSQDASSCPADDDRLGVGGGRDLLGSSPRRRRADATPPSRSNEPNGDGDARSTGTPEANSHRGTQLDQESDRCQIASPTLVADLCEAWQDIHNHLSFEPVDVFGDRDVGETILFTRETNWVAQEMWEHFAQKGIYPDSPVLRKCRADLLEVYCSQDSQLTKHARSKSMWAERHCLSDGDLATMEDRKKLYDRLLHLLPRDIWLSPKCKAWCKWNEFNSKRSTSLATKIMNARKADEVHLLLCDALFQFQTCRAPTCHAHLEQPSGSQMLYQEELAAILEQSYIGRCDMCQAGNLQHPVTHMHLQKRTQVVTTSQIMYRRMETLRCDRTHEHDVIAGSYQHPKHGIGF